MRAPGGDGAAATEAWTFEPVRGAPAPWYGDAVHARAVDAAARGWAYDVPAGRGAPLPEDPFIRPGALLPRSGCTLGFVFGPPGARIVSTAGHCVKEGERLAVQASPDVVAVVGTVVLSRDGGVGDDYALVEVDAAFQARVDPAATLVGGPSGPAEGPCEGALVHVGHPRGVLAPLARPGVCLGAWGEGFAFAGAAAPGDSGSPVLDAAGRAVGLLTHRLVDGNGVPRAVAGTPLGAIPAALASAPASPFP